MDNITAFANHLLDAYFARPGSGTLSYQLDPVKGYFTTRVYRFEVRAGDKRVGSYYIKESGRLTVDRFNGYIKREYDNTRYVYENFAATDKLATTHPLYYSAEHNAFLIERIDGTRLDKRLFRSLFLLRDTGSIEPMLETVMQWLDRFQAIAPITNEPIPGYHEIERNKLEFLYSRTYDYLPEKDKPLFTHVFEVMERCVQQADVDEQSIVIKHNDFAPWNMIADGERLTVIDYPDCAFDHKFYDLMYFVNSLTKLGGKLPFSGLVIRRYQDFIIDRGQLSRSMLQYYRSYFLLQDIEFVLRGSRRYLHHRIANDLRYLRLKRQLKQSLPAVNSPVPRFS